MPQTYEIKDPRDGSIFELQSDHPPTPEEARTAVAKYRVTAAKASGQPTIGANGSWEDRGIAGQVWHPTGAPSGHDEMDRPDRNIVGGIPGVGGVSPEEALGLGMAGRAVKGAISAAPTMVGRAVAGAKAVVEQAAPTVKYEVIRTALRSAGVPEAIAIPIAMAASGYQRGAKAEPTSPAESASGGVRPPVGPPPEPVQAGSPAKSSPTAKPAPPPPVEAAGKPALTAEESRAYLDMRRMGKTDQQARETIAAARELNARYNLKPPTAAEKRFPKGMRGRSAPDEP